MPASSAATYTDLVPAWQFAGEACVIDCRDLRDNAPPGQSSLIRKDRVIAWEKQHRPLGPGDIVLFKSGYSDAYYKPLPQGRRYAADPLAKQSPAWPDPDPGMHGIPRRAQGHGARHRQRQHGAAGRPGRADPFRRPQTRDDLDRKRHRARRAARTGAFYCILSPKYSGGAYARDVRSPSSATRWPRG